MFMESVRIIIDRGCQVRGRKSCHEFHLQLKIENACLNWQAIFWATLWTNGGRSEKSATWVFFRTDPFSFSQGDFARKWWIQGDFEDPFSTILAVAAGNEMFVSRNSPVQSWIRFGFLLIAVYLRRLYVASEGGGTGLRDCSLRSKLCCCDRWGEYYWECKYWTASSYWLGCLAVCCQSSWCFGLVMLNSRFLSFKTCLRLRHLSVAGICVSYVSIFVIIRFSSIMRR